MVFSKSKCQSLQKGALSLTHSSREWIHHKLTSPYLVRDQAILANLESPVNMFTSARGSLKAVMSL